MLIFSGEANGVHSYEFGPEDAYVQYRYAGGLPWQCLASLCAVLCQRVRGSQIFFVADAPELHRAALAQEDAAWYTPDSVHHPSQDLVLNGSSTVILYPTTRDGVENAAELIRHVPGGQCLLVRDLDFRTRLANGTLSADALSEECKRSWIAEIRAGYEAFDVIEGPYYSYLAELLPACIREVNESYS